MEAWLRMRTNIIKMASYEEVGEDSPPYPDPLESLPYWGHGPGEDITSLPEGWEARVTPEGRVFFIKWGLGVLTISEHKILFFLSSNY